MFPHTGSRCCPRHLRRAEFLQPWRSPIRRRAARNQRGVFRLSAPAFVFLQSRERGAINRAFRQHLGITLCFGQSILDFGDGFLRPAEISRRGKTPLKKSKHVAKGGEHFLGRKLAATAFLPLRVAFCPRALRPSVILSRSSACDSGSSSSVLSEKGVPFRHDCARSGALP